MRNQVCREGEAGGQRLEVNLLCRVIGIDGQARGEVNLGRLLRSLGQVRDIL